MLAVAMVWLSGLKLTLVTVSLCPLGFVEFPIPIPEPHRAVITSSGDRLTVWTKTYSPDLIGMPCVIFSSFPSRFHNFTFVILAVAII
jgi:hypothetical protein